MKTKSLFKRGIKFVCIVVLLLCSVSAFSQNEIGRIRTDSLRNVLQKAKTPEEKLTVLKELVTINRQQKVEVSLGKEIMDIAMQLDSFPLVYNTMAELGRYYYNLDLSQNRQLTLQDLLGDNYVEIANESIIRQMKERDAADENAVYWGIGKAADDGMIDGFQTVDENTSFYINADGNPVVCFEKYEVSPGYMGFQEFEIQKPAQ